MQFAGNVKAVAKLDDGTFAFSAIDSPELSSPGNEQTAAMLELLAGPEPPAFPWGDLRPVGASGPAGRPVAGTGRPAGPGTSPWPRGAGARRPLH